MMNGIGTSTVVLEKSLGDTLTVISIVCLDHDMHNEAAQRW